MRVHETDLAWVPVYSGMRLSDEAYLIATVRHSVRACSTRVST